MPQAFSNRRFHLLNPAIEFLPSVVLRGVRHSNLHYAVEMVRNNIEAYLHQLQQALPYVPPIPVEALYSLHIAQDYEGMVQLIKNTMNIDVCLRVGGVNSGGRDAPAWIELPPNMPFYGSSAFREMTITMFIRRSFLEQSTYDQAAIVVAHELSHIVLDSIGHPLRREEKAVDLTAMLLGFCALYASGCYREETSQNGTSIRTLGYLSQEEVELANQILAQRQSGTKTKAALLSHALRGIRARICVRSSGS